MSNYGKLKNDELQTLLRERGLPTTGKKADMVDRLTKDDAQKATATATTDGASAPSNAHPEDEIDWDDEDAATAAAATPTVATTAATANDDQPTATDPDTVANPPAADALPFETGPLSASNPTGKPTASLDSDAQDPKVPAPTYAAGLAATDLDAEIEKRKKRAERFNIRLEDDETLKKLERAKKFGDAGPPKGLDEALPERERKERKRARDDTDDPPRNKRRGGARAGGSGRGGGGGGGGTRDGDRRRDSRDTRRDEKRGDTANGNGHRSNWMSAADRERAEARKAKWAAKPAATS